MRKQIYQKILTLENKLTPPIHTKASLIHDLLTHTHGLALLDENGQVQVHSQRHQGTHASQTSS